VSEVREVLVLGGGPAGLWAALSLLEAHPGLGVTVLEREDSPGGMAASFTERGLTYDLGSHRLHPSSAGRVLDSVRTLLGDRLLERPRNGRILLEGRFVRFPLKPADMLLRLPPSFAAGVCLDTLSAPFRRPAPPDAPFDVTLRAGLGRTICERFYFPYAWKLWGLPPGRIDGVQARRRVSAGSLGRMLKKVASGARRGSGTGGVFYYPEGGFGEIFTAAASKIEKLGGRVLLRTEVLRVTPPTAEHRGSAMVSVAGREMEMPAHFVFSTLPVTELARMVYPPLADSVLEAAAALSWRAMVLLYLELGTRSYTPFDAHYFPGPETVFSRLSEPRNYSGVGTPEDRTGLCLEIPCMKGDPLWEMGDGELSALAAAQLSEAGLPVPPVVTAFTRRLENAYPSYTLDHSRWTAILEDGLDRVPCLVSFGRQGLFAHDNTHHAMETGMEAAGCLDPRHGWDAPRWAAARTGFREHTVVD
jgi:protoporphyrinogen oxidase